MKKRMNPFALLMVVVLQTGLWAQVEQPNEFATIKPSLVLDLARVDKEMEGVDAIVPGENTLYILETGRSLIHPVNAMGEPLGAFGGMGQGPGEFSRAVGLFVRDKTVFVMDEDGMKINVYDEAGNFLQAIKTGVFGKESFHVDPHFRVTFCTPYTPSPLAIYDFEGHAVRRFGKQLRVRNGDGENNIRFVFGRNKHILTIGIHEPVVEYYSWEGELIHTLTLAQQPVIREAYLARETMFRDDPKLIGRAYRLFFQDACLIDDQLYLLVTQTGEPDVLTAFTLMPKGLELQGVYRPVYHNPGKVAFEPGAIGKNVNNELLIYDMRTHKIFEFPMN